MPDVFLVMEGETLEIASSRDSSLPNKYVLMQGTRPDALGPIGERPGGAGWIVPPSNVPLYYRVDGYTIEFLRGWRLMKKRGRDVSPSQFVFYWEDLSDDDYNDLIVTARVWPADFAAMIEKLGDGDRRVQSTDPQAQYLRTLKLRTMRRLGLSSIDDVSYITDDLIKSYAEAAEEVKSSRLVDNATAQALSRHPLACNYGTYGNSLVFTKEYVYFKRGDKGTPNYGCGSDSYKWRNDPGDEITYQSDCKPGVKMYLLCCPTCF